MHTLYRLYDEDDTLLWVGVTKNLAARVAAHRRGEGTSAGQAWASEIAHVEKGDEFESIKDAWEAEAEAIRNELPKYNINHHPMNQNRNTGRRRAIGEPGQLSKIMTSLWGNRDRINPELLMRAIDERRQELAIIREHDPYAEPMSYAEVADQVGTHRATFSRLKVKGALPGPDTLGRILTWVGATDATQFIDDGTGCPDCARAARLSVRPVGDAPLDAVCAHEGCDSPPTHSATLAVGPNHTEITGLYCADHALGHDVEYTVVGNINLPVADRATAWDGPAARQRVFEKFTRADGSVDTSGVAQAFLWRDPEGDPETRVAYKLGFADVISGTLTMVPRGIFAAASVLAGGRGGVDVPVGDRPALETRVCTLYDRADLGDCPFDSSSGNVVEHVLDPVTSACRCGCRCGGRPGCQCAGGTTPPPTEPAVAPQTAQNAPQTGQQPTVAPTTAAAGTGGQTAAIVGTGTLSASEDPETQAAVTRVQELLREGAVGVSVATDMNPDDMPTEEQIHALTDAGDWDGLDALMADMKQRPRHVAIVDTPAFADARMTLNDDGTVTGPVTFEGTWTGDFRMIPYGSLTWQDENGSVLPIPIIWDRQDGDHSGMTVGSITQLERVDGQTSSARTPDTAVAAAARSTGLDSIPASFFDRFPATGPVPVHIDAPVNGLRRIYGHAAPSGVCHRSDMGACFQYPGDVDPTMRHFHTGTSVTLDNGETVRVGALTLGGLHLDTGLARRGVSARDTNRHREDANEVFALVRAWADDYGCAMSGVVVPGLPEGSLARALACAPSVELWPEGHGRTLVGIHLVPTPAWPVAASAGSATQMTGPAPVTADDPGVQGFGNQTLEVGITDSEQLAALLVDAFDGVNERLGRMERALALVVTSHAADGIELPE